MRFISKYDNYSICYQTEVINHFGDGNSQEVRPLLNCQFRVQGMNPWETDAAKERFTNRGLGVYEDHVTPEDPSNRWSVFDTEQFQAEKNLDDKTRVAIEEFLLGRWELGNHFIHVEKPKLPLPWPSYHDARPEGVAGIAATIGCLPEALEYERANENRPQVIAEIEELMEPDLADEAELVTA